MDSASCSYYTIEGMENPQFTRECAAMTWEGMGSFGIREGQTLPEGEIKRRRPHRPEALSAWREKTYGRTKGRREMCTNTVSPDMRTASCVG